MAADGWAKSRRESTCSGKTNLRAVAGDKDTPASRAGKNTAKPVAVALAAWAVRLSAVLRTSCLVKRAKRGHWRSNKDLKQKRIKSNQADCDSFCCRALAKPLQLVKIRWTPRSGAVLGLRQLTIPSNIYAASLRAVSSGEPGFLLWDCIPLLRPNLQWLQH